MNTYTNSEERAPVTAMTDEGGQYNLRIAESLKKALTRNTAATEDKIQVRLDDGWIHIRIQA